MRAPKSNLLLPMMLMLMSDIREQKCGKERSGFTKIITVLSTCVIYLVGIDRKVSLRLQVGEFETSRV